MAIPNEAARRSIRIATTLTRIAVLVLGLAAITWGGYALPLFWHAASAKSTAASIIGGDGFRLPVLLEQAQQAQVAASRPFCNPALLRSLVVLRFSILSQSIVAKDRALIDAASGPLYDAIGRALSCEPADPLAWLTLFWLDAGKHGLQRRNANYLQMSYALGPNEAWIALWRNQLAFDVFAALPPDLAKDAVAEFVKLVGTGQLYWQTAEIFESAAPAARLRILEKIQTANADSRQAFARALRDRGLDVTIPGVQGPDARPWR